MRKWELKVASETDVQATMQQLTDHMNEKQRDVFRDKLLRYVRKPDRDLILAVRGREILGLVCIIDKGEFPPGFPSDKMDYLRNFALGTQLLVHPSMRRRGIGTSLLLRAELWARERGRAGHWIITHRKADWYRQTFSYEEIARISSKGVKKIVMAKKFE